MNNRDRKFQKEQTALKHVTKVAIAESRADPQIRDILEEK